MRARYWTFSPEGVLLLNECFFSGEIQLYVNADLSINSNQFVSTEMNLKYDKINIILIFKLETLLEIFARLFCSHGHEHMHVHLNATVIFLLLSSANGNQYQNSFNLLPVSHEHSQNEQMCPKYVVELRQWQRAPPSVQSWMWPQNGIVIFFYKLPACYSKCVVWCGIKRMKQEKLTSQRHSAPLTHIAYICSG